MFIVLTGENWDAVMYDLTRARGNVAIFYFISYVVIAQLILLNLFLAILLKNFDESSIVERKMPEKPADSSKFDAFMAYLKHKF